MPVFCLFTLGRHCNFTAGVTLEQPDLLCTALALNIELLSIIVCRFIDVILELLIIDSISSYRYKSNVEKKQHILQISHP
jgi:hypothetical protein